MKYALFQIVSTSKAVMCRIDTHRLQHANELETSQALYSYRIHWNTDLDLIRFAISRLK